jgi:hypothetical protein
MKKWLLGSMMAAGLAVPALAFAGTSVGVSVRIGDAPPPPVVVIREEPRVMLVPNTTVYVVDDRYDMSYDMFRYGVFWYVYNDGYWYRGRSHRGPFRVVEARYVPRAIISVPSRHWRHPHGGPPGQMKKKWVASEGHGRGKGHGR